MMVVEEKTNSLFPSDLFLQPGEQPPVTTDNLAHEMLQAYRLYRIFAHEDPVRAVVRRTADVRPEWIHAMHGATIPGDTLTQYSRALLEEEFAYRGVLFGRPIGTAPPHNCSSGAVQTQTATGGCRVMDHTPERRL
jgi:hypothetical protein